jgi:hypothetical protein
MWVGEDTGATHTKTRQRPVSCLSLVLPLFLVFAVYPVCILFCLVHIRIIFHFEHVGIPPIDIYLEDDSDASPPSQRRADATLLGFLRTGLLSSLV